MPPSKRLIIWNYLFFKVLSTFSEVFLCYIDIWFLTYGIRAQGLGVSLLHLRHIGIFAIDCFLQCFRRNNLEDIYQTDQGMLGSKFLSWVLIISEIHPIQDRVLESSWTESLHNFCYKKFSVMFQTLNSRGYLQKLVRYLW